MSRSLSFTGALMCALLGAAGASFSAATESAASAKPQAAITSQAAPTDPEDLTLAQAAPAKTQAAPTQSPSPKPAAPSPTPANAPPRTPAAAAPSTPKPAASKTAAPKATTTRPKTSAPQSAAAKAKAKNQLQQLDWRELLPENERKRYNPNAPAPIHGPLGEGGPPAVQTVTTTVNAALDQQLVRLPGFIVPLGPPRDGVVREFYLVPYIGEDIHVPPPPSNQMVYVRSATGIEAEALHEAYWVTGKMRVETRTTPLGTSAYSMVASKVEQYLN